MKNTLPFWPEWTVEEKIGQGSYGSVYRIRKSGADRDGAEICSALKVLRIPIDDSEIENLRSQGFDDASVLKVLASDVKAIENEIRVMISVASAAGIVTIEDYHVEEMRDRVGWNVYIRMELLESLNAYVRRKGSVTWEEVVKMGCDLCDALTACESVNIIHRDIKPANIFRNRFGQFKLGDFGVAKQLEGATSAATRVGTPSFEAPELFFCQKYDHTVDIYGLGMVLYTYLNRGRKPFYPPWPSELTREDAQTALDKRLSGQPIPPIPGTDPELFAIIEKACAFEPSRRYQSAAQMKADLDKYRYMHAGSAAGTEKRGYGGDAIRSSQIDDTTGRKKKPAPLTPNTERPEKTGRPVRSGKPGKRNTGLIIAAALAVTAAGLVTGTIFLDKNRGDEEIEEVEEDREEVEPDTSRSSAEAIPTETPTPVLTSTPTPEPTSTPTPVLTSTPTPVPTSTPIPAETPVPEVTKFEIPGIVMSTISSEETMQYGISQGVFVSEVKRGSAAEAAGIPGGSVIVAINGNPVSTAEQLNDFLSGSTAGEKAEITYVTAAQGVFDEKTVSLAIGVNTPETMLTTTPAPMAEADFPVSAGERPESERQEIPGITMKTVSPEESMQYGFSQGVFVSEVKKGSAAEAAGIPEESMIVAVNGISVLTVEQVMNALSGRTPGEETEITYVTADQGKFEEKTVAVRSGTHINIPTQAPPESK